MKCRECGADMRVAREDWPYPDLPGVTLHGVEVRRCTNDAEHHEVDLPHMDGLHRALAGALLTKRARLAGPEIRFLRELAGWDAARLAPQVDVTPVTLSRWENDKLGHSTMADRLIRMLAADELGLPAPRDALEHLDDAAPPTRVALRFGASGWRVVDESDPVSVWISFADDDREAVLWALEASFEEIVIHLSGHPRAEQTAATASDGRTLPDVVSEDPGKALRIAVDTLRALRPLPERSPVAEAHVTEG
jgi:DNA-binding transcriptional regulator YiaG